MVLTSRYSGSTQVIRLHVLSVAQTSSEQRRSLPLHVSEYRKKDKTLRLY